MLIKKRDPKQAEIEELTTLLTEPIPENKRFLVERELRYIKTGIQGETDAAYFIDFHFAHSRNWTVIHDLCLEHQGRVAQIDHLLINRFFHVYVLESKNFSYGVKITGAGEFLVNYKNRYVSIESPIEQNNRHIIILEEIFKQYDVTPKRLGITIIPTFKSYILMSPKSRVIRPSRDDFDTGMVIKSDALRTQIDKDVDKMNPLSVLAAASKIVSGETIKEASERLAAVHSPMKMNYRKRFGLDEANFSPGNALPLETHSSKQFYCFQCKKKITEKVAKFCWDNKKRFHGKAYCFDCQKVFSGQH